MNALICGAITHCVSLHQLGVDQAKEDAPFWTPSQVQLFHKAREQNSDRLELVDELDALLHKSSMKR